MRYIRVWCVVLAVVWTFGGIAALVDGQIQSGAAKLTVLITMTGCWIGIGGWPYIWKKEENQ